MWSTFHSCFTVGTGLTSMNKNYRMKKMEKKDIVLQNPVKWWDGSMVHQVPPDSFIGGITRIYDPNCRGFYQHLPGILPLSAAFNPLNWYIPHPPSLISPLYIQSDLPALKIEVVLMPIRHDKSFICRLHNLVYTGGCMSVINQFDIPKEGEKCGCLPQV